MKRVISTLILGLTLGLSLSGAAVAQTGGSDVLQLAAQERFISLDEAVSRVRKRIDGEVISAKTRYENGRPVHYIKVYDRGRVRSIRVDASSGRIG